MEKYCYNQFNEKFSDFMFNLNKTFKGDKELEKFNKKLKLVNPKKLIRRYVKCLKPVQNKLQKNDDSIFEKDLFILPDVNFSRLWKENLSDDAKNNIWEYLNILYVLGEIHVYGKTSNLSALDNINKEEKENKTNEPLDINKLLGSFSSGKLGEQLSGINKNELAEASTNIKNMFADSNSKTSNLMCDMINDISSELGNLEKNENGIQNILNIAQNVANKFKPKLESGEFDVNELLGNAQNMMKDIYEMPENNIKNDNK
jgi:hypothetical protein